MQHIVPHLWFNTEAKDAAEFYVSVFGDDSIVRRVSTLHNTPSGDCDIVSFSLWGYELMAISAGPFFRPNPSISFMINFDPSRMEHAEETQRIMWEKLIDGGTIRMPFGAYPFSSSYGWVEDKYGVSWQLILTNPKGEPRPSLMPAFLFVGDVCGKAKEATDFYMSVFKDSRRGALALYPAGMSPDKEGTTMFTDFSLSHQWFVAMDSAAAHNFSFTEGISFIVRCQTQEEIDYYWERLSAVPEAEQCGWCKDNYGVSWQITPICMDEMMAQGTPEQIDRVTHCFLAMKKFDIAALQHAYDNT